MSMDTEELAAGAALEAAVAKPSLLAGDDVAGGDLGEEQSGPPELVYIRPSVVRTTLAAALATAAAAWMVAGMFSGFLLPRGMALVGVTIGALLVMVSYRGRQRILQYLVAPAAMLVGALAVLPDARGGTSSLPALVIEAVRSGGLLQAPVPFDPGWRFILIVLFAIVAAGAASLAISNNRPKLAVLLPLPITVLAGLVQPADVVVASAAVSVGLTLAGMSLANGAELSREAAVGARFETRRLLRSAVMAVAMVVALVVLSKADILFPQPDRNRVVPPTRPTVPPPQPDSELFTASLPYLTPLRLGVIDVYSYPKDNAWLLPPFDAKRLKPVVSGNLPDAKTPPGKPISVTFKMGNESGHSLPDVGGTYQVKGLNGSALYDPRTETVRLANRVTPGLKYTVLAASVPTGKQLAEAPAPPLDKVRDFADVPPPPDQVQQLLIKAPNTNLWDRLQFMRAAFYSKVVAAGGGKPVDVSPQRVVEMLNGKEASPYEITAGETLLARWAGVPARMGYGYYGGDQKSDGTFSIHPRNGSTWLEVYFTGYDWVPIVGVPQSAKASTSQSDKQNTQIRPAEDLSLVVYVAMRADVYQALYEVLRYWLAILVPVALLILALVVVSPGLAKRLRSIRRRSWGLNGTPRQRIAVAYCEFRDLASDLTVGDGSATPLMFLDSFEADTEHQELAWLVTRALWGDLRRDLRTEDAEEGELLAASVSTRMAEGQPGFYRFLAFVSRTSLRAPYSAEVPNLWPGAGGLRLTTRARSLFSARAARRQVAAVATMLVFLAGCGGTAAVTHASTTVPDGLVPGSIGDLSMVRENAAEKTFKRPGSMVDDGRVYSVHNTQLDTTEASIQISRISNDIQLDDKDIYNKTVKEVQATIGVERFRRVELPGQRAYMRRLPDQSVYLWFQRDKHLMFVLITRKAFGDNPSDGLLKALVRYEQGKPAGEVDLTNPTPSPSASASTGPPAPIRPGAPPSASSSASPGALPASSPNPAVSPSPST